MADYNRGDIVMVSLDPTLGHEQQKRRPCLVVSGLEYNKKSTLIVVCPITSTVRPWPWQVPVQAGTIVGGIQVDQVRSIDRTARSVQAVRGAKCPHSVLQHVQGLLDALFLR
ncbi:MAG: type II toxin-antitoxin system PemK/MazF family toxin [Chloracidobacterium sp.]|nr:type II toxin-antitoxin system PemK/MazF family toxin [Chloracidobacterium sp.]